MFGPQSLPIVAVRRREPRRAAPTSSPRSSRSWATSSGAGAKQIHVDLNAYEIAKNHPVDLGLVADPKLTLAAIADALEGRL